MFRTIRSRLITSFFALASISILIALAAFWITQQNSQLVNQAVSRDFQGSISISQLAVKAQTIRRYEKEYFMYIGNAEKQIKYQNEWRETYAKLQEQLNSMMTDNSDAWTAADRIDFQAWKESLDAYGAGFEQVIAAVDRGELTGTLDANGAIQEAKNKFRTMVNGTVEASQNKLIAAQQAEQQIHASNSRLVMIMAGLVILSVLVTIIMLKAVPNAIIQPIRTLSQAAEGMSKGELEQSVPTRLPIRDFDSLAETLERMRISQKALLARFYRSAENKAV